MQSRMATAALLQHLHATVRNAGSGAGSAPSALAGATTQLQVLGAQALRDAEAAELAEELIDRAEQLVGNKKASSRLLGLQLLRSIVSNCNRRTFLQRHAQWSALLLSTLRNEQQQAQQAQQPSRWAAEACACLAAYFSRVGRMLEIPGLRRDGAAAATKLAAMLLQQGQQQRQAQEQQAAAAVSPSLLLQLAQGQQALLAALDALPASFRQQHKALEAQLLLMLMQPGLAAAAAAGGGGGGSGGGLLPACAAALPRIAGDASSWSAFCQRLLCTGHRLMDVVLLGLDDSQLAVAGRGAVDPSAEPLPGMGIGTGTAAAGGGARGSGNGTVGLSNEAFGAAFGQLGAVLQTLEHLLVGSFPAPVPVPTAGLLLLVGRLLAVDDGAGRSGGSASSSRLPELCLQLPAVQAAGLSLLQRLLAAAGAAATPQFVAMARVLSDALQSSAAGGGSSLGSPLVRCQLFAAARQLLQTAGAGVTRHLAAALLQAAGAELYGRKRQRGTADGSAEPARKKARKGKAAAAAAAAALDDAEAAPLDDLGSAVQLTDMAVQSAVLQALLALCTTGAPLLTSQQRQQLDDTAVHMAATTAAAACQLSADAESAVHASLAGLQLAAFQLLLATMLAPTPHRPQHLAPALSLFRGGSSGSGGSALAAFCRHALLCCEALIHPRSLPLTAAGVASAHPLASTAAMAEIGSGNGASAPPVPVAGMPRFWGAVDAALLLAQEAAAAHEQQQGQRKVEQEQQDGRQGKAGLNGGDLEMAEAGAEARQEPPAGIPPQVPPHSPLLDVAPVPASPAGALPANHTPGSTAFAGSTGAAPQPAYQQPSGTLVPPQPVKQLTGMAAVLAGVGVASGVQATPLVPGAAAAASLQPKAELLPAPAPVAAEPAGFTAQPAGAVGSTAAAAAAAVLPAVADESSDSEGSLPDIDSGEGSSDSKSDSDEGSEEASG